MQNMLKFVYMKLTFEEEVKENDFFFKLFQIWMFVLFFKGSLVLALTIWFFVK